MVAGRDGQRVGPEDLVEEGQSLVENGFLGVMGRKGKAKQEGRMENLVDPLGQIGGMETVGQTIVSNHGNEEVGEELKQMVEDDLWQEDHQSESKYGSIIELHYYPWLFRRSFDCFI